MGTLAKNQSKGQASSDRGYTLMELVIVMSILIMVALLSQSWLTSQLPKVTQGNKHRVTFLDNHHYTILDDDNSNGKPDPGELLVTRNIQTDYIDVTLTSTNNPIFHPRGTASNLGTVTLKNSAGSKSISVGITGRVKLQSSIDNP
jgi:prepilin-type N-terminal cleavage/methylation domain-containing protein